MRMAPRGRDAAPGPADIVVKEGTEKLRLSYVGAEVQDAEVAAWYVAVDRRMLFYTLVVCVDTLHPRTVGSRPSRFRVGRRVVRGG